MNNFPSRLKEIRQQMNISQKQVSSGINVTESLYQKYEYGNTKPNYEVIIKLSNFFNVSSDYLLGLSDNPERR